MDDSSFRARLSLLVVDEAHLVYVWSKLFRKAYGRIGYTRARLDYRVQLLLLNAILRAGAPYDAVMKSFSLSPGSFFDLHCSNLRQEIHVTTSIITSSLTTSLSFPKLRWVVGLDGITIIFVRDRMLALRICLYLMTIEPAYAQTIRWCDSTNDVDYDSETFEMIFQDHSIPGLGSVLVATTILTLGIDVPKVKRVLTLDGIEIDEEI